MRWIGGPNFSLPLTVYVGKAHTHGGISDDLAEIIDMCVDQGSHVLFHAMGCHTLDQCRSTLLWQLRRDIGTAGGTLTHFPTDRRLSDDRVPN